MATPSTAHALIRVTWTLVWVCVRMLFVVARPLLRLPQRLRWLQIALGLTFVVAFFYRPAIAYYWFWASVVIEVAALLGSLLFGKHESVLAWWRGKR